jgi:hypothetical protein
MKKSPKKRKQDDDFEKLYRRNWKIMLISLVLIAFFLFLYPLLFGGN